MNKKVLWAILLALFTFGMILLVIKENNIFGLLLSGLVWIQYYFAFFKKGEVKNDEN